MRLFQTVSPSSFVSVPSLVVSKRPAHSPVSLSVNFVWCRSFTKHDILTPNDLDCLACPE